ncbi:hypothetical protein F2Q70_00013101 [Brassica cretica]|uniref:Uncharacterized protein n=1 Tax=Brassica cretica TaxID=69181 RepID=A0A8S9LW22_BRACR|nr:hypothetical protein F2Q70_00013101 [Brassica cretica]
MLSHNSFSRFGKSLEVSDVTHIQTLDLSSNSFQGPLPHWICKLRPSMFLDLSNNIFNGSIHQCLRNTIVPLRALNLQNNNLTGILHQDLFVNATNLELVDVSANKLEGKLPESLINCISLKFLNVRSNKIKDKFPSWLSSLPSLNVLILRSNEFYGPLYHPHVSIGFQSLKVIDISHNHFNGTLPPFYFSKWHGMTTLREEHQSYTVYMGYPAYGGFYRSSMEMVNKGVDTKFQRIRKDFKAIDFSENEFGGKIPSSIGFLKELRLLNLSGNTLTGNIPQSLANLPNLEELDLSRNQLSGQIPSELGSLSFLSIMNFSHNNLEGPIPRSTQFQGQNCSAFMYNSNLYGLEDICGKTHVPNPTPQESEDLSKPKEQVISWISAGIAYGPGDEVLTWQQQKNKKSDLAPAEEKKDFVTASDNHPVTATDNHPVTARLTVPAINLAFQYALSSVSIAIRTTIQMTCPTYLSRLISPTLDWGTGMLQIAYGPGDEVLTWQQQKNKKSDLAPAEEKKDFG